MSAPLAYDLGRTLGGEQRGRIAGVLTAFSPSMLLFGVTSVDYAFAVARARRWRACSSAEGSLALVAGSIAAAFASFFSWLLLAIPGLGRARRAAALRVAPRGCRVPRRWRPRWSPFNALLALAYGYDPFSALRATETVYHHGVAAHAAVLVLGVRLAGRVGGDARPSGHAGWRCGRCRLANPPRSRSGRSCSSSSLLGFTKAETERIWLPFVPLACVAAAAVTPSAAAAPAARRAGGPGARGRAAVLHGVVTFR